MTQTKTTANSKKLPARIWRLTRTGLLIPVFCFLWYGKNMEAFAFLTLTLIAGYYSMFQLRHKDEETPMTLLWFHTAEMTFVASVMGLIFYIKTIHNHGELSPMLLTGLILIIIRLAVYPIFSISMIREGKKFYRRSFWSRAAKLSIIITMMIYVLELDHFQQITMGISILLMFASSIAYLYWFYRDPDHRKGLSVASQLTMSRIVLTPVFIWVFFYDNDLDYKNNLLIFKTLALIMVVAFMVTDFLDGYLARKMGEVSTLGKYLDPFSDKISNMSIFLCFMASDYAAIWMVALIYFREASVETLRTLAASENVVIAARRSGKWKTAIQGIGILIILISTISPIRDILPLSDSLWNELPQWVMGFITVVTLLSGIDYFYSNRKLLLRFF